MLHHTITGTGPVVLFLHGFCEDSGIWKDFAPAFEKQHTVVCMDLPGFGQSPVLEPSLEVWAKACFETLDLAGIQHFHLVGHSLGGYLALAMLELEAERLSSLTLFHSTAKADTAEKKEQREKQIQFVREYGAATYVRQLIPGLFNPGFQGKEKAIALEIGERQKAEGIVTALQAMINRPDRRAILATARIPIGIISGAQDPILPLEQQAELASLPQWAWFRVLKESAHMGFMEERVRAQELLMEFLEDPGA